MMDSRFDSQFAIEEHEATYARLEANHRALIRRWIEHVTAGEDMRRHCWLRNDINGYAYRLAAWPAIPFPYPGWQNWTREMALFNRTLWRDAK
jgi:hypothetical protein